MSQNSLTRHQSQSSCAARKIAAQQLKYVPPTPNAFDETNEDDAFDVPWFPPTPPQKPAENLRQARDIPVHEIDAVTYQITEHFDEAENDSSDTDSNQGKYDHIITGFDIYNNDSDTGHDSDPQDDYSTSSSMNSEQSETKSEENTYKNFGPDQTMRQKFKEYVATAKQHFLPLSADERRAIKVLHLLKQKKAPMNTYESVMLWHFRDSKIIHAHETLADCPAFIGRKSLIKRLARRYNYEDLFPTQKWVKLPVSGTRVKITCHNAKASIVRLLTDPRNSHEDYLLWDNNPTAGPPEKLDYVADLITGKAYRQTHAKLITKKGQQLLPIILYCDGTPVSHFHNLEIIQVKIALGILTREARLKGYNWATLGYIEKVHEQGGRGRDITVEANHMDTQDHGQKGGFDSDDSSVEVVEAEGVGDKNDQDFHAMMAVILSEYIELQRTGFTWDFHDPVSGITYENMEYQLFMPFIRSDTKEADLLCAKYNQRYSTKQLCRACHIPLQEADDHMAKHKRKTVSEIRKLVDTGDLVRLKEMSQSYLRNAFYKVRFSMGNDYGIHGGCPSELLHAFLLGLFKYLRDILFEMVGKDSEGAKQINAMATLYSRTFARQSDRTIPGTSFSKGIQVGKLMAKDFRGVLLIMLVIFRSTKGRAILLKCKNFKKTSDLDDWMLLLETMLTWEAYLNEPVMELSSVKRLKKKHRFIMYLMRKIAQRNKGMGLKLMKFHAIIHIVNNIIEFGVPLEFDTSANEMHHKPAKQASTQTQRASDTFNFQTSTRLTEYDLLDLGIVEIETGHTRWQYFDDLPEEFMEMQPGNTDDDSPPETFTGEAKIEVFADDEGEACFNLVSQSKFSGKSKLNTFLVEFLLDLQTKAFGEGSSNSLPIYTLHRRDGQIFRGHPNYRGKGPWRDWVWVKYEGYPPTASHIWCFVVLKNMPTGRESLEHGGIVLKDGTYAVVETATLEDSADTNTAFKSDLLTPIYKEGVQIFDDGTVGHRTFYLADTEAFLEPCCVIPDIGGPCNKYFAMEGRNYWAKCFAKWVCDSHDLDQMDKLDSVKEEDAVMDGLEEDRPKPGRKS